MKDRLFVLLIGFACFVLGFVLGRSKQTVVTDVRYEEADVQRGHYGAPELVPIRSELPDLAALPAIPEVVWTEGGTDTVFREADTAAIVRDYSAICHYSKLLFDNADGKLTVSAGTQYNRLAYLDYEFTPIREIRTEVKERAWMPFVRAGYGTNGSVSVGAGVFWGRVGVEYAWHRGLRVASGAGMKSWHEASVLWRPHP